MKTSYLLIVLILIISLSGCSNSDNISTYGNCDISDCVEKIEIDNNVSEINDIIGIDGVLIDANYNQYYWEIADNCKIYVNYVDGTIRTEFDNELLANRNVNFSRYNEIKYMIDENENLTYEQMVEMLGGVDGVLISKSEYYIEYSWVNSDDDYLNVTFSREDANFIRIVSSM